MVWTPKRIKRPWRDYLTPAETCELALHENRLTMKIGPKLRALSENGRKRIQARASARARRAS